MVNSCTVTNFGDQKSRKWLRRAKRENPGAVTVLTGCYPQAFPEEAAKIEGSRCGNGFRQPPRHFGRMCTKVLNGEDNQGGGHSPAPEGRKALKNCPWTRFAEHTRAFVKVEDGCNRQLRLLRHSHAPAARCAAASEDKHPGGTAPPGGMPGTREVVLTAISLPSYGTDSGTSLVELVENMRRPRSKASSASAWAALTLICCTTRSSPEWRR